jgi:hypothetical protein
MMTVTMRLVAAGAAIALGVVAGCSSSTPGASPTVGSPPPSITAGSAMPSAIPATSSRTAFALTEIFTSPRYGYSVHYPSGGTVKAASKSWSAGTQNAWGSGINDELKFQDPQSASGTVRFSGASQPLAQGQTADQWIAAYASGAATSSWPTVTIGGQTGRIDSDGVPAKGGTVSPGGVMYDAVVVSGNRAYNFNMDGIVDRPMFEAFLATVVLDPASAP